MNKMEDTDVRLMQQVQADDIASFDELITRHQKNVLNFIYRFIGSNAVAEDLAQEAFLRVYRARKSYQPTAKFTTWLYQIVQNLCSNHLRQNSHKLYSLNTSSRNEETQPFEHLPSSDVVAIEDLKKKELIESVKEAINSLPPNQRMALVLNRYQGLAYQEIAERMDISVKAVKSLLVRARENIKVKLSRYVENEEKY